MAELNLLPRRVRQTRALRKVVKLGSALGFMVVLVVGGLWYLARAAVTDAQNTVQQNQQKFATKSDQQSKATSGTTAADDSDTAKRVDALNTLSKTEINWDKALALPGTLAGSDIHLKTYSYAIATTGITLSVAGQATSTVSFASFVQALELDPAIKSLAVGSYTYQPASGAVGFTLSLMINPQAIQYSAPK